MNLKFDGKKVRGEIIVPEKMEADFVWNGKTKPLKAGINQMLD
jgi:hypothetical protein